MDQIRILFVHFPTICEFHVLIGLNTRVSSAIPLYKGFILRISRWTIIRFIGQRSIFKSLYFFFFLLHTHGPRINSFRRTNYLPFEASTLRSVSKKIRIHLILHFKYMYSFLLDQSSLSYELFIILYIYPYRI